MKSKIRKLHQFITRDINPNEKEAKDLAILLRVLSLLYIAYYIFTGLALAHLYHYAHAFLALICSATLGGCFICTYDNKTKLARRIFHAITISATAYFTLATGWYMNFQWNILINILVIFYSLDLKMNQKFRYMKLLLALMAVLAIFTHMAPSYREGSELFSFLFQTIHALFYVTIFCLIAYCYCTKFNLAEDKLRKSNQKLREMASLDSLTQLPNRRSMHEHLETLVYDNDRIGKPFCIAIGDVDHFKKINDSYGHDTGDYVLVTLSELFQNIVKGRGKVARWGGEEFLFTFEGMNVHQAKATLEILRLQIEKYNFRYKDQTLKITMTFGLEEYSQITGIESGISKADQKLYEGKNSGRNKVVD